MRLIFITLVVANCVVAVWGLLIKAPSQASGSSSASQQMVVSKTGPQQAGGKQDGVLSEREANNICELVGPFDADSDAEDFVTRLSAIGVSASLKPVELPGGETYWVHLPPESSRESAFRKLADLQAQNIESYVIGSGRLQNAISLGVFSKKPVAQSHLAKMQAAGLDAQLTVSQRKELELWVEILPAEADKMSSITWTRMLDGLSAQERRQNFCLPVAS